MIDLNQQIKVSSSSRKNKLSSRYSSKWHYNYLFSIPYELSSSVLDFFQQLQENNYNPLSGRINVITFLHSRFLTICGEIISCKVVDDGNGNSSDFENIQLLLSMDVNNASNKYVKEFYQDVVRSVVESWVNHNIVNHCIQPDGNYSYVVHCYCQFLNSKHSSKVLIEDRVTKSTYDSDYFKDKYCCKLLVDFLTKKCNCSEESIKEDLAEKEEVDNGSNSDLNYIKLDNKSFLFQKKLLYQMNNNQS